MYEQINRDYIRSHYFESDGLCFPREAASGRLDHNAGLPGTPEEKQVQLRKRLQVLIFEKLEGNPAKVESACAVSWELVRKYMSGKRKVTRDTLAKLCVGMRLSIEETQELFRLEGHSLEPEINLLDAIVVDALRCGEDIDTFYEECQEFGLSLFR